MKVAISYQNGNLFEHFGHTEEFKIYTIINGNIIGTKMVDVRDGHGVEHLNTLQNEGVNVIICNTIGPKPYALAQEMGFDIYAGIIGLAEDAISSYLNGTIKTDESAIHCCGQCHH